VTNHIMKNRAQLKATIKMRGGNPL